MPQDSWATLENIYWCMSESQWVWQWFTGELIHASIWNFARQRNSEKIKCTEWFMLLVTTGKVPGNTAENGYRHRLCRVHSVNSSNVSWQSHLDAAFREAMKNERELSPGSVLNHEPPWLSVLVLSLSHTHTRTKPYLPCPISLFSCFHACKIGELMRQRVHCISNCALTVNSW